jgi:hypothetical protein
MSEEIGIHVVDSLFGEDLIEQILGAAKLGDRSMGIDAFAHVDNGAAESLIFASWAVMALAEEKTGFKLTHRMPGVFVSKPETHVPNIHADKQNMDGSPKSGCEDFDISAVLYLNDGFVGGELVFAWTGLRVAPAPGRVAIYGGGIEHAHYVDSLVGGDRWACPMWFSIAN